MTTSVAKAAVLSLCGRYRYRLTREWPAGRGTVLFVMLNPSTADAEKDDPTVRRCVGFAQRWGFQRLVVGNLFALRATDPQQLGRVADAIGPENDQHLIWMSDDADVTIAAWGTPGAFRNRDQHVLGLLRGTVEHLGLTKQGHPRHPLYLRADAARTAMELSNA